MIKVAMMVLGSMLLLATPAGPATADDARADLRSAYWEGVAGDEWDAEQRDEQARTQLKSELHSIQLWLERWAVDHDLTDEAGDRSWGNNYPPALSQLMQQPCCSEHPAHRAYGEPDFYPNPFGKGDGNSNNARCVPFGWTAEAVGNFSYITQYNELGNVCAYVLIGYDSSADGGHDIDGDGEQDGVVIMLAGGEPLDQHGRLRRDWSAEQREAAVLHYWDASTGRQVVLNWPK
ncbi:hypothetical protein KDL44_11250 [bacterium]|nr:hypothetical protein [bacterium]